MTHLLISDYLLLLLFGRETLHLLLINFVRSPLLKSGMDYIDFICLILFHLVEFPIVHLPFEDVLIQWIVLGILLEFFFLFSLTILTNHLNIKSSGSCRKENLLKMSEKLFLSDFVYGFQQLLRSIKNELEIDDFLPESLIFLLKIFGRLAK